MRNQLMSRIKIVKNIQVISNRRRLFEKKKIYIYDPIRTCKLSFRLRYRQQEVPGQFGPS